MGCVLLHLLTSTAQPSSSPCKLNVLDSMVSHCQASVQMRLEPATSKQSGLITRLPQLLITMPRIVFSIFDKRGGVSVVEFYVINNNKHYHLFKFSLCQENISEKQEKRYNKNIEAL